MQSDYLNPHHDQIYEINGDVNPGQENSAKLPHITTNKQKEWTQRELMKAVNDCWDMCSLGLEELLSQAKRDLL